MRISISHRIGIIASVTLLLSMGVMVLISAREVRGRYLEMLLDRGRIAAEELGGKLEKLLSFGLFIDDLPGFNEQCSEAVYKRSGLRHALVLDNNNQVVHYDRSLAYHLGDSLPGELTSVDTLDLGPEQLRLSRPIEFKGHVVGKVIVAMNAEVVEEEVSSLARRQSLVAIPIALSSLIILLWFLHDHLGRPATMLLDHISSMRRRQLSAPVALQLRTDEIGLIAVAFDQLISDLASAQGALQSSNRDLQENAAQLHMAHRELAAKQEQMALLNTYLQQRVDQAVTELRHKDEVLISQSRQAAMGEMIGNIAHQWRQPLNVLAMLITNIKEAQESGELSHEFMEDAVHTAQRLIQKMSSTINDFRNFYKPDKEMAAFSALAQIKLAVNMVAAGYKNSLIDISVDESNDCSLWGFANEYSQVLLNLLGNAKDAIIGSGAVQGRIDINVVRQGEMGVVRVSDSGGGIPKEILDKIFEPYFTTKQMGTGIGLYMSQTIIQRNMNGRMFVENFQGGCTFSVSVPLAESLP